MTLISLSIFDIRISIQCETPVIAEVILKGFSAFVVDAESSAYDLRYQLTHAPSNSYHIAREGQAPIVAKNNYELLYYFEKDLTIELELSRKDLFFVHGAVLELDGKAFLISAPSGSGKSTTTWALLHHGFNYLSDELAPIEIDSLRILPFPHALNQKKDPPAPYDLPSAVFKTDRTMHIPVEALPCKVVDEPVKLAVMFYVRFNKNAEEPSITPVSAGEGCMHLFANGLNQLQHENKGLAVATEIAQKVPAFRVETTQDLMASAKMVRQFCLSL